MSVRRGRGDYGKPWERDRELVQRAQGQMGAAGRVETGKQRELARFLAETK